MKLNPREMILAWLTLVVVVCVVTYNLAGGAIADWKQLKETQKGLDARKNIAEHLLQQQPVLMARLNEVSKGLPSHPEGKDVTADLLRTIEQTARANGLVLTSRQPDNEEPSGDLFELAIHCRWQGDLESLTRFLYALQIQGAMLDVSQLTVAPADTPGGQLKGRFTVDMAYTRQAESPEGPDQ